MLLLLPYLVHIDLSQSELVLQLVNLIFLLLVLCFLVLCLFLPLALLFGFSFVRQILHALEHFLHLPFGLSLRHSQLVILTHFLVSSHFPQPTHLLTLHCVSELSITDHLPQLFLMVFLPVLHLSLNALQFDFHSSQLIKLPLFQPLLYVLPLSFKDLLPLMQGLYLLMLQVFVLLEFLLHFSILLLHIL